MASVVLDTQPSLGQITNWDGLGGFTYVPNYHAYGQDSFTYHDVDQYGQSSNEATATISVIETAPVASDVSYSVLHDNVLTVPPNGVLSSSYDADPPDMGNLSGVLVSGPAKGTLSDYIDGNGTDHPLLVDGSFVFTPPPLWAGTVTFQFNVSDGILSSGTPATATIEVTDQAPVAGAPGPYYVAAGDVDDSPNTLTVEAPGVLTGAYDGDGDKITAQLISGPSNGQLTLNQDGSFKYTPNVGFSGTDSFIFVVSDGIKQSGPTKVTLFSVLGKLDAATIKDNAPSGTLDAALEDTVGAYVPLDNVDQDYDGTADMNQPGAIEGEKDLLPITIKAVGPKGLGGTYTLNIPNNVRVWQNADRSGAVDGASTFADSQDTKLYVEGTSVGSGMLSLTWSNGTLTLNQTDKVLINVFDWEGPQNVPGTGIYTYTATGGDTGQGNSQWLSPVGGTVFASMQNYADGADEEDIHWGTGPAVGEAVYQASSNYIWDRDVNIVQIMIGQNSIAYREPPGQDKPGGNLIDSVVQGGGNAMSAVVTISNIEGPVVNGQMRGVKFMQVGFAQNVETDAMHGTFNRFTPAEERVSSLEGSTLLDTISGAPAPWYDGDENALIQNLPDEGFAKIISTKDWPQVPFSDMSVLTGNGMSDAVDEASIVLNFTLYVAARTTDSENNADAVYVQLANANWQFDGSGKLTDADVGTFGTWSQTGNGNTGDVGFTVVTTGSTVPKTTGTTFNDAPLTWTTEPPFSQ